MTPEPTVMTTGGRRGDGHLGAAADHATVLLVDDRSENLVAMSAVLEPLGARVVTADSGAAALRAVLREELAVILLDIQMPDLDGLEVARTIRSRPRSAGVPIIFLTAVYDEADQVFAGYGSGAVDYIVKPVDPFILRSKVEVFIDLWTMSKALRNQAELEAAHESLALAQRAGESGFWDWNLVDDRFHWSAEYADLHGLPVDGDPERALWLSHVHPDDRARVAGRIEWLLEEAESWDEEFRIVHPERGERWIRGKGKLYRDRVGRATRFVGIDFDVTDRRAAQDRLREIEQQRALVGELGALLDGGVGLQERLDRLSAFLGGRLGMPCTVDLADVVAEAQAVDPGVVIPMVSRGRRLGAIVLGREDGRPAPDPQDVDLELLHHVAARAAVAIENALLYEREHEIASELQRSMLPAKLPSPFGIQISACYVPAEDDLEVGGDWFDAFTLDDGGLVSFVGDVVGHGIPAASAMGQLRSATRALGPTSAGPAELVTRLDRFAAELDGGAMATLVTVEVDRGRRSVRYACAGHPPPVLVLADGSAELLEEGRSAPLASFGASERGEARRDVPPGATVVLYSDGLVERRGVSIDQGFARLLDTVQSLVRRGVDLAENPRPLVDAMLDGVTRDDVCVLCIGFRQATTVFHREVEADPGELRELRAATQSWLAELGVDGADAFEVILATNEAVANAIEHGHRSDGRAGIVVDIELAGDHLRARVKDAGRWKPPAPTPDRGRGLALIRDVMEHVEVEPSASGTTVTMERRISAAPR